jgi:hypothetical protein
VKATVYAVMIRVNGKDRVEKVTLDKDVAAEFCRGYNRLAEPIGRAWHVALKLDVPRREQCQPAWNRPKRKRKPAGATA